MVDSDDDDTPQHNVESQPTSPADRTLHPALASQRTSHLQNSNDDTENYAPISEATAPSRPPVKRRLPLPRRSMRPGRQSLSTPTSTIATESLPTPLPSQSPEPKIEPIASRHLADITEDAVNAAAESPQVSASISHDPVKSPAPTKQMEKPMDIVVRARAKGIPQVQESAEPKPRMVITYLVLTNFKSYAGRQEVGPFHASFSSVVGPNGSGKSNVIDSLLFVFGFRASKMRQGKISSLIHNSANHPDLEFCEVEVHFQKIIDQSSGGKHVVPDTNVVVSRRAFKNNSSKYYINGSTSDFTTVTTMLREEGIDLDHKRFLILQGEVESIAQMKPKAASEHDDGLLEYLEDIIGTSKYKSPIEESANELEALNEVCREKNARVDHVNREKSGLEGKKNAALAYVRDENDLAMKQSSLWQIFVHECEDNIQVTTEAVSQQQEQLQAEADRHQGSEQEIAKVNKQHAAEAKHLDTMQHATQAILKQLAKADKETVKFDEKRKHLANKIKKLEKTFGTSQSAMSESRSYLQRLQDDLARNATTIQTLEGELSTEESNLAAIREGLKGKTQGLSDEIASKQKALDPWHARINEKHSAIAVARSELDILRDRESANERALVEVAGKLEQLQNDRSAKARSRKDLETELHDCETTISSTERSLEKLNKTEHEARARLSASRQKIDEAKASLSSAQTQGNVINALMRLRDSGRIIGFHGRLGNLGAIDTKYDIAISTACPALDNLVVDSVEVGQQCIEFLKKGNLGRANFICLDRLGQRDLTPVETPEGVPRLFDLIKSKDSKFLPAFFNVLQNTLVTENLEQANRVAYGAKRWRVVTLDGKLIDKSGTMSGGGTRVARGAMSSKITAATSKEQVNQLEKENQAEEAKWSDFQEEQSSLVTSLRAARERLPTLETQIQRLTLEADSIEGYIADTQKRQKELQSSEDPQQQAAPQIAALEKDITKHEREIEKLSANTRGLEEEVQALQERIMEIGGVKLRGQKAKVDGLREQLSTLHEEVSNAEVEQSKTEKAQTKHEKSQQSSKKEIDVTQTELHRLEEEAGNQSSDISRLRKEAEEAQESFDSKQEEHNVSKAELDRLTTELNESRGVEIDMRNRLEENQKALSENLKRLKYWQEKLGKLSLQNVRCVAKAKPNVCVCELTCGSQRCR